MGEREEDVVRSFLDACVTGSVAEQVGFFADGASYRVNAWHEPHVGTDAIQAALQDMADVVSSFQYEILNIASAGDVVLTERTETFRMHGKDVRLHTAGAFEVNGDGKITRWREYNDTKEVQVQLAG